MSYVLGIDIGGTSIKAGLFSDQGSLLNLCQIPTGSLVTAEAYERVNVGLRELCSKNGVDTPEIVAIGLDVPGPVDDRGRVGMLPNIDLDPDGLKEALCASFQGANLAFVNDANAAALGELWQGSAKGLKSFVMVTLGTGVGGGVVIDGKLVSGAFGAAGEIGHISVNKKEERVCGCGRRGCLEQYASAKGIVRLYREELARREERGCAVQHDTDTLTVFKAAAEGDSCAQKAIDTMCEYLGFALAQVSCVIDPEAFLIGGGVAGGFDQFSVQLSAAFRSCCLASCAATRILPCSLGNKAGMYGVAFAALKEAESCNSRQTKTL